MTAKAEREKRIHEVLLLQLTGHTRKDILKYADAKEWNLNPRTIDTYIAEATKDSIKIAEKDSEINYAKAINRLELLFKNSYKINDYKTCLGIVQLEGKYQGLDTPAQVTVSLTDADTLRKKIDDAIKTDPDNRARITAALKETDDNEE